MKPSNLISHILVSTSLLATACTDPTIEDIVNDAGDVETPPAEHGPTPIGTPGEQELSYDDGTRWSCRTQKVSMQENPERFVTLNPNADIIYPGALVQAASLASGSPEPIPVRRGEGTIVLSLVNGADARFQRHLDEVTQGNVVDAQNELLNGVQNDAIPAKFVYDYQLFDSSEELAAAMDVKVEWLSGSNVHVAAEASREQHVIRAVIRLTQEYFTTTYDMPTSVAEYFHPEVGSGDLAEFVQPGNPAAYISSVTYGRQFYLVFESTSSKQELKAAVDAVYNGLVVDAEGHLKSELRETQSKTSVKVFAIGGDAESALDVAAAASNQKIDGGLFQSLSAYLKKGGTFSTSNPGLPVSYTVRDVKRRAVVKVNLGTEFTERQCNPLVNESRIDLTLDANNAIFDANGLMVGWPGDTLKQNEPQTFHDIRKETDAAGRTWAKLTIQSNATGLDCQAMAHGHTVITVTRPDLPLMKLHSTATFSILSGGTPFVGSHLLRERWGLGWFGATGLGYFAVNSAGQFGYTNFTSIAQPDGHVSTTIMQPHQYMKQWTNGVSLRNWSGPGPSIDLGTQACAIGSTQDSWTYPGTLGEVRIYNGELSNAQREMAECELGQKWGIGVEGCKDGRPVKTY
ncbi:MAG: thiol-activated cytolysin family protein [Kofleriaceae bacterium]|nr:thiol-activated cytolysin family protein [Kofleriaceae bacterium]